MLETLSLAEKLSFRKRKIFKIIFPFISTVVYLIGETAFAKTTNRWESFNVVSRIVYDGGACIPAIELVCEVSIQI